MKIAARVVSTHKQYTTNLIISGLLNQQKPLWPCPLQEHVGVLYVSQPVFMCYRNPAPDGHSHSQMSNCDYHKIEDDSILSLNQL